MSVSEFYPGQLNFDFSDHPDEASTFLNTPLSSDAPCRSLNFKNCRLTTEQITRIATSLTNNTSLLSLNLSGNLLRYEATMDLAFALRTNSTLTSLELACCNLSKEKITLLAWVLRSNASLATLDLSENELFYPDYSNMFGERIEALHAALKVNTTLKSLSLKRNTNFFPDPSLHHIQNRAILSFYSIEQLDLSGNCDLDIRVIASILSSSPSMRSLNLSGTHTCHPTISSALTLNSTLTHLDISNTSIGKDNSTHITEALCSVPSLTSLNLDYNQIEKNCVEHFLPLLAPHSPLKYLSFSNNYMGFKGARKIAKALLSNTSLLSLNLHAVQIKAGTESWTPFATLLALNTTLTALDLSVNFTDGDVIGASIIAPVLATNTTLLSLNLRQTSIDNTSMTQITEAVTSNSTLQSLDLGDNEISNENALLLASMIGSNTSLTSLSLAGTGISTKRTQYIATALSFNTYLRTLNLSANDINNQIFPLLATTLSDHPTLTELDLSDNPFGSLEATEQFVESLFSSNHSLTNLHLQNHPSDRISETLDFNLRRNRNLQLRTASLFEMLLETLRPLL